MNLDRHGLSRRRIEYVETRTMIYSSGNDTVVLEIALAFDPLSPRDVVEITIRKLPWALFDLGAVPCSTIEFAVPDSFGYRQEEGHIRFAGENLPAAREASPVGTPGELGVGLRRDRAGGQCPSPSGGDAHGAPYHGSGSPPALHANSGPDSRGSDRYVPLRLDGIRIERPAFRPRISPIRANLRESSGRRLRSQGPIGVRSCIPRGSPPFRTLRVGETFILFR